MIGTWLALAFGVAGAGAFGVQVIRRFGLAGAVVVGPMLVLGVAIGLFRKSIADVPVVVFGGSVGALLLAIVIASRGHVERFVDRDLLPQRLRDQTAPDGTTRVQWLAVGIFLVLFLILGLANPDAF